MKNIFKRLPKKALAAVATIALVAGVASQAIAGFGPDRPTRAWSDGLNGFDHVTFNSFTGVPGVGDERNFLQGVQVGRDNTWRDPVNGVTQDAEVEMKIYIHNNASSSLNDAPGNPGVAKNVQVRAALPSGTSKSHQVTSYISASNAQPQQIWDTLDLTGANGGDFELAYIPGSAKMFNHINGQTTAIGDSLVTTGVTLPDQKGCFEYVREITFRVKVKMPRFEINKQVSKAGDTSGSWKKSMNADKDDLQSWMITFKNAGQTQLKNVHIIDEVPAGLEVVPGTVKLINGNYPNGYVYPDSAISADGRKIEVNIGHYNPEGVAYVGFRTKVVLAPQDCGVKQFVNKAWAVPEGRGGIWETASITVDTEKECDEPSYVCESLTVEKLGGRRVRATVKAPASNGVTVKTVTFNYGDGSEPKVTNSLVDEYEYKADGTFKITATVTFTVDGVDKTVSSDACTAMVTFESGKPVTPSLPKTGAGSLIGLFTVVTTAAAVAHNVISRRGVQA